MDGTRNGNGIPHPPNGELHQRIEEIIGGASCAQSKRLPINRETNKRGNNNRRVNHENSSGSRSRRNQRILEAPNGRVKWVSLDDDGKIVARLIVGAGMASAVVGFPVTLHAKYEANVNTSIKGIAIAAKRCVEELGIHIACAPHFRENRNELTLTVVKISANSAILASQFDNATTPKTKDVLTVARSTDYRILAGAIAKRTRDNQQSVLRAIGASAVFASVRALATCREYLEQDATPETTNDVIALPRFSKVRVEGRDSETTVLELCVFPATDIINISSPTSNNDQNNIGNETGHTMNNIIDTNNGGTHIGDQDALGALGTELEANLAQTEQQVSSLPLVNPPPGLGARPDLSGIDDQ
uniref:Uncharacterized protein n=1 Tax=Aureoumbra lagunensis TaxID=44058 RepID=A0A7S3K262_9STRA|mmetsp:Transcript_2838/g.3934  ORF Transcript_2838/g.3934 Transcript_2838/m.3934 type:complete len:359 (-) Transcript_2838:490-1566(-)|eukprot:CAMPEP_0197286172 /NCGR_PEP_ID=MMETSP0890-20130614/1659_1 /TAXON_ID=44058 ORGANISM="Aureoumbra lagunensis, Strain CCMP1510" /NCGR_SAMPLE_ID=MMETSP0890 /ASSEMBLY_ACC=CAM_ASM_000533 /LENGTH=358 /DNA_ID=CAMNT_0042754365 /DNA_START=98 /DNA_END=1174 /DNA_ORIENTATION=-